MRHFLGLEIDFNSLRGLGFIFLKGRNELTTSRLGRYASTRTASPATSVEKITTPILKKPRLVDKGKEKADSLPSSVWNDVGLVVERAHKVITIEDLKVFFGMPSNKVVARHIHKFVQVIYLCNLTLFYFYFYFYYYYFFRPEGFNLFFKCWGRAFISPRSTSLKKQRSHL